MPNDNVTGVSNFPVVDITHKPKRMQGDSIRQQNIPEVATVEGKNESVLTVVTLERAITFYAKLANKGGANAKLFLATSEWLKELLATRSVKVMQEVNAKNKVEDKEEKKCR